MPENGSVWVQGDYLHFYTSVANLYYRYLGAPLYTNIGTEENPNYVPVVRNDAVVGSIWIDDAFVSYIHYIDASKKERIILERDTFSVLDVPGLSNAIKGSIWLETESSKPAICTVTRGFSPDDRFKIKFHGDSGHADTTYSNHDDFSHNDTFHADAYTNHNDINFYPVFHIDSYLNGGPHGDGNQYSHNDTQEFSDTHADVPSPYNPNNP
jgi:hypothetical protein